MSKLPLKAKAGIQVLAASQPTRGEAAEKEVSILGASLSSLEDRLISKVEDAGQAAVATGQFRQLKEMEKGLEAKKKEITSPLNQALKKVRDLFRPLEERLENAIVLSRNALDIYNKKVQAELEAKRERLEAKVEDGAMSEVKANRLMAKAGTTSGVGIIPTRKMKVVKIEDEEKIPDMYWTLNISLIRQTLMEGKKVPGAKLVEEEIVGNFR